MSGGEEAGNDRGSWYVLEMIYCFNVFISGFLSFYDGFSRVFLWRCYKLVQLVMSVITDTI